MTIYHKVHPLKKLFVILFALFLPLGCFAFEISEISNYPAIGIKVLVKSDTTKNNNRLIQSTKNLQQVLGDAKAIYETQYVYKGTDKDMETHGSATWYAYYPPSYNGRVKCKLYYETNNVMADSQAGDLLVVAKKSSQEILLLIIQQGSPAQQELYDILGMHQPEIQNKSWWQRLWSSSERQESEYEIESAALPVPAIPEKSWMRVYFTPGTDCEENIIRQINDADRAIDVAVYSITNDKIVESLIAAHRRGVNIRIISDKLQSAGRGSLIGRLTDDGIPVLLNKKHKIMHNKFAIFDNRDIETGSYNWTNSATQSNAENCMFFPEQKRTFTDQFNYLWNFYQE